jgi:hypothetical protein
MHADDAPSQRIDVQSIGPFGLGQRLEARVPDRFQGGKVSGFGTGSNGDARG